MSPWDFAGKSTGVGCHCLLRIKLDTAKFSIMKKGSKYIAKWKKVKFQISMYHVTFFYKNRTITVLANVQKKEKKQKDYVASN